MIDVTVLLSLSVITKLLLCHIEAVSASAISSIDSNTTLLLILADSYFLTL